MTSINKSRLRVFIDENPLRAILFAALVLRLLAAFFSKGYAFHDDHFCVIRVANSWAEGVPQWLQGEHPPKHSMVYAGANAILMWIMSALSIVDTEVKATVLRLVHAVYSMFVVYFGYKIVELISSKRNAILAGWILAVLWFMPYLSVKFLAELVCVPPVLAGFYVMLKAERGHAGKWIPWLLAGVLFGIAFTIRLHIVLFAGGLGIVLLFRKQWLQSILFTLGFLLITFVLIGIPDMLFFDYPYQYVVDYFIYNSENAYNYITGSPFKFLLTTFGFLVPPVSVFLMWGYLKTWKVEPKIFLAVLIFFLVHSFFPNKQERFLLPMYPLLIIMGVIGWNTFKDKSRFWSRHEVLYRGLWKFFWTINVIAAIALALTFTKKDRVAPLHYLSQQEDVSAVIIESERGKVKQPPVYYLGSNCADFDEIQNGELGFGQVEVNEKYADPEFIVTFNLGTEKTIEQLTHEIESTGKQPNYVVFKGDQNFDARKSRVQQLFPGKQLVLIEEINPSNFDLLLHILNPRVHRNTMARIYRVE
ncbi:glycosyltransferase family 39 protein [Fulvivirga sp. 29W222]|uniref:Glycosyltransferase family 39 protein n=1 Tax=Fulvivirga marina TaxID=2494733 RepID=A0A937KE52_9BACT|nr:glycosyltransferase family 39 protein [Fulvivirga marina]MBL6449194.1 glycosyltransferase family 39 protein [Fulvivirga marina]